MLVDDLYISRLPLKAFALFYFFQSYSFFIGRNSEESYCEIKVKKKKYSFRKAKSIILKKFLFLKSICFEVLALFDFFFHSNSFFLIYMACNGILPAIKLFNPPALKRPQLSNPYSPALKLPSHWNKKHADKKLMHKPFIQHTCRQIKKQSEI